jgi:hypothetical protein
VDALKRVCGMMEMTGDGGGLVVEVDLGVTIMEHARCQASQMNAPMAAEASRSLQAQRQHSCVILLPGWCLVACRKPHAKTASSPGLRRVCLLQPQAKWSLRLQRRLHLVHEIALAPSRRRYPSSNAPRVALISVSCALRLC